METTNKQTAVEWFAAQMEQTAVEWFAVQIEQEPDINSDKGSWGDIDLMWLFSKLGEEAGEVGGELNAYVHPRNGYNFEPYPGWAERVIRECADVANVAMMIADNVRNLLSTDDLVFDVVESGEGPQEVG